MVLLDFMFNFAAAHLNLIIFRNVKKHFRVNCIVKAIFIFETLQMFACVGMWMFCIHYMMYVCVWVCLERAGGHRPVLAHCLQSHGSCLCVCVFNTHTWPTPLLSKIHNRQLPPLCSLFILPTLSLTEQTILALFKTVQLTAETCIRKIPRISFSQISALSRCVFIITWRPEICICSLPSPLINRHGRLPQFIIIILFRALAQLRPEEERGAVADGKRRYPSLFLSAADIVARMIFFSWSGSALRRSVLKRFQLIHQRIKC